jgi:hypothetical protein
MELVYLRGKNPKILKHCDYDLSREGYFRRLQRYDGVEWLNSSKVLGTIDNKGMYCPDFPHGIDPQFIKGVANQLNLVIRIKHDFGCIIDGIERCDQLYYYKGRYHKAKELF